MEDYFNGSAVLENAIETSWLAIVQMDGIIYGRGRSRRDHRVRMRMVRRAAAKGQGDDDRDGRRMKK
jgi:hypothetical protein